MIMNPYRQSELVKLKRFWKLSGKVYYKEIIGPHILN